ncbi:hypothetical protein GOODEAATRI_018640 [Goodea atripinnis]|uniref:Inositol polyphosphate-related phosphatase domain-containing protein n=1 Tax=Goodea atripinnis TaxID=208336 RepID=A0ABV0PF62_9TELE
MRQEYRKNENDSYSHQLKKCKQTNLLPHATLLQAFLSVISCGKLFVIAADVTTRFDQVFWFGDFNFRLSKDRADVETIMKRTVGGDMSPLLEHDQLSKQMKDGM